ncbi:MAG: hypothetical protein WCS96_00695 [Victivallales bacterium]|jgi:hypothetical protein
MNEIRHIALFVCLAGFFSAFAPDACSQGAGRQALISDVKVESELVDTPIWKVMNVPEKPWKQKKWIQIDVDFTTAASRKENENLENVTVEYELLLPTEDPKSPFALLSGKALYWAFALDGGAHHLVAFVPPRIIEKFATGKKFNNSDAKKFDVKVEFKMNDTLIGAGFSQPKGTTVQATNKKFSDTKTSLSLQRQKDGILGQDKTPWANLNYDHYEQVKPDSSK